MGAGRSAGKIADAILWLVPGRVVHDGGGVHGVRRAVTARHRRWLRSMLMNGRRASQELFTLATRAGISRDALYAAKDASGVKARKDGQGAWYWELSPGEILSVSSEVPEVRDLPAYDAGSELTERGWDAPEVWPELTETDGGSPEVPMPHKQG